MGGGGVLRSASGTVICKAAILFAPGCRCKYARQGLLEYRSAYTGRQHAMCTPGALPSDNTAGPEFLKAGIVQTQHLPEYLVIMLAQLRPAPFYPARRFGQFRNNILHLQLTQG